MLGTGSNLAEHIGHAHKMNEWVYIVHLWNFLSQVKKTILQELKIKHFERQQAWILRR